MKTEENSPESQEVAAEEDNGHCDWQSEVLRCVLHQNLPDGVEQHLVPQCLTLALQVVEDGLHQLLWLTDHQDVPHQGDDVDGGEEDQDDDREFVYLTQADHLTISL